ncbi:MAG: glycosyltransferase family 4 protein [Puniceicoccaceae bacterium]
MSEAVHLLTHEFRPYTGGIGVYVEELAGALSRIDVLTTVWAPSYNELQTDDFPFKVNRIEMSGKQGWGCRMRFAKALMLAFPDKRIPGTVVLAEPGPIRLWMYASSLGLPKPDRLVVILHGSEVQLQSKLWHRKHLFRKLLLKADAVGAVSQRVRASISKVCPEITADIVCVPGAVRHAWQILPPVRERNNLDNRQIIQVGRVHPRKGQDVLVEAVGRLPSPLKESVEVRFIGPVVKSAYRDRISSRAGELGIKVVFEGTIPELAVRRAYESAALCVMPSQPYKTSVEGLGLALLEAQHFGCPVIGANTGGIDEALRNRESGLLFPPGDAQALADAIKRILTDSEMANSLGREGSLFVRGSFSWERNVRQLGLVRLNKV